MWKCEFCGENNLVDLEDEEIPKNEDTTFMLQPAPCTAASGKTGVDESLVIFCVDTSGSMCVTTEVSSTQILCVSLFSQREIKHLGNDKTILLTFHFLEFYKLKYRKISR